MLDWRDAERERNRRLLGAAGTAVALHVVVFLVLLPVFLPYVPAAAPGPNADLGDTGAANFLASALMGAEIALQTPPSALAVPEPVVQPDARPPVEPAESVPEPSTTTTVAAPATDRPAASQSPAPGNGTSGGDPGAGTAGDGARGEAVVPAEMALRPRVYVQPRIPEEIVRKRKIDDFVLLQVLVGTDGSVRDVRVLRAIANCDECTQSAVETARRYRYEPVTIDGRLVEMWTVPFSLRFSDHR